MQYRFRSLRRAESWMLVESLLHLHLGRAGYRWEPLFSPVLRTISQKSIGRLYSSVRTKTRLLLKYFPANPPEQYEIDLYVKWKITVIKCCHSRLRCL